MKPTPPDKPFQQNRTGKTELSIKQIKASKSLGQHFLFDLNLTRKIARLAQPETTDLIVEIGPGPAGLTRALLMEGGPLILCIEKDKRFFPELTTLVHSHAGRLNLVQQDALLCNEAELVENTLRMHQKNDPTEGFNPVVKIVANLPYNISIALLIKWLKAQPFWWNQAVLMFQKEVVQRLSAQPGHKSYGRLSVFVQSLCHVQPCFSIPARAFTPPPKVESTLVMLTPKKNRPSNETMSALETLVFYAFNQRRKMLKTALKPLFQKHSYSVEACFSELNLDANLRAEALSLSDYLRLADFWVSFNNQA